MLIVRLTLLGVVWEEMPLKTCFLANEKQPATGGDRCRLSVETVKERLSVRVGS